MKLGNHLLILGLVGGLAGAGVASWWRYEDLKAHPAVYRSVAKLVVLFPAEPVLKAKTENSDFYGTCIDAIESSEMARRALKKVVQTQPELVDSSYVEVRAVRMKDSGVVSVLATGNEARLTQAFLNAVLDEFVSYRRAIHDAHFGGVIRRLQERAEEAGRTASIAGQAHEAAWQSVEWLLAKKEERRLEDRLLKLRDQFDDLELELKVSQDPELKRVMAGKQKIVEREAGAVENELRKAKTGGQAFELSLRSVAEAEQNRQKALEEVAEARREFEDFIDVVAIQERACLASAYMPAPLEALQGAAIGGAIGGGCLMFGLAWTLTMRPKVNHQLN